MSTASLNGVPSGCTLPPVTRMTGARPRWYAAMASSRRAAAVGCTVGVGSVASSGVYPGTTMRS